MKFSFTLAAAAALGAAVVSPATASATSTHSAPKEERIAFVNRGGIRDWRAGDYDTLYIQDRARRWYKAELMHRVTGLPFAWSIGFDSGSISGTFDRFSAVVVDGLRVPVQSLTRVDGPPLRKSRSRAG